MNKLFVPLTPESEKLVRSRRAWPQTPEELSIKNILQRTEMDSPLNVNGTREEFRLPPEEEEADPHHTKRVLHYIHCGRAQEIGMFFDLAFSLENVHGANLCTGCDVKSLPVELRVAILMTHLEMMLDIWIKYPVQFCQVFKLSA